MNRILIDTDVILDFLFDRKPFSDDAAQILALCEKNEIKGFVTSVIISNVYYLLRQRETHEKVIESLKALLSIVGVLITDKEIIAAALNSSFRDFEDALQNYSAESNKEIQAIVTRNVKDYKNSSLSVMMPDDYLKMLIA